MVSFGVSIFSALEVPRRDHTLKDSQQSVVHHERAPSQALERDRYPTARCTGPGKQRFSVTPEYTFMAAGVVRVVFVYDLASGVLLAISLSVFCSVVAILTRVAGWILVTACFSHFVSAAQADIIILSLVLPQDMSL